MGRAYARIVLQENRGGTMGKKDRAEYRKQYKESNEKGVYPVVSLDAELGRKTVEWGEVDKGTCGKK